AEARVKQARAAYFPQLDSSGLAKIGLSGALNGLHPVGLANSPLYRNFAEGVNVYHPGFDSGRTKYGVNEEQHRREVFAANLDAAKAFVTLDTKRAYYSLLQARRLREVSHQILRSREFIVRQAQAFYEGKLRSRVDLELARFSLSEAQLGLLEAENNVRIRLAELGRAMGASQEADYDLEEVNQLLPEVGRLSELLEEAYQNRPELLALAAERDAAAESIRLAQSQRKPMLSFFFSGGYARFTNVVARQLLALGTGLTFPILTWGKLEGQIEEAEARKRALDNRYKTLKLRVEVETRTGSLRLQHALRSIETLKARAAFAREAARLARARYQERLGSFVELTQAEANLAEAEAGEVIGVYASRTAEAELRFAVGRR
ncbi:MAG: TolC family protein, partial [Acidobacteria bacterium]|nr:TolC family protein [Acidobacteriota bacterium]